MHINQKHKISLLVLVLFITGSIDSIRNLPATALFGSGLLFFALLAAISFLLPAGLVAAKLSNLYPEKKGVHDWVETALGKPMAFIAIWLQWINTMVWYPTILSFIAGTAAFAFFPSAAHSKFYLVAVILIVFWCLTLINLKGFRMSARFVSVCTFIGMVIPMVLIIGLGAYWYFSGKPIQIDLSVKHLIPDITQLTSWISLTAIMTAYLGMELIAVHANTIEGARKKLPRALIISVIAIFITMAFGSLAIAMVIPVKEIQLISGTLQAFEDFFSYFHLTGLIPVLAIILIIGSLGGMINWIISPAKGLMLAAENHYLPHFFIKLNQHAVPARVLIAQALVVSFVCMAFLLMPSVNASYWLLTDLSTQLYILMYILMFLSAILLLSKQPGIGNKLIVMFAVLAIFACIITEIVGFFPPTSIVAGGVSHYEIIFAAGMLLMILPALIAIGLRGLLRQRFSLN